MVAGYWSSDLCPRKKSDAYRHVKLELLASALPAALADRAAMVEITRESGNRSGTDWTVPLVERWEAIPLAEHRTYTHRDRSPQTHPYAQ